MTGPQTLLGIEMNDAGIDEVLTETGIGVLSMSEGGGTVWRPAVLRVRRKR